MNLYEEIKKIKNMMNIIHESYYLGDCTDVGNGEDKFINDIFSDATTMAYYVGNPDEDDWGKSIKITKDEFFSHIDKKIVKRKILKGGIEYCYVPDLNIYYIYNYNNDIHYFFK